VRLGIDPPPFVGRRFSTPRFSGAPRHKTFAPLFRPTTPDDFKATLRDLLGQRFDWIDKQLAGKRYVMGDEFTVADAYLFTVLRWSPRVGIDLGKWKNITAYLDRVPARPKVQEAMKVEGLLQ
jgi:glutathione S-transferase